MEDKKQEVTEEMIAQYIGLDGDDNEPTYEETPLPMSYEGIVTEDLEGMIPYDIAKFEKGVKDYSYIAGAFTALRNSGMSEENAMKWLLGEVEVKCLDKQLTSQEKVAKSQAEISMKHEL